MTAETSQNPLSTERLDAHRAELRAALPDLYRNDDERTFVDTAIVPHFRKVIDDAVAQVALPLTPQQIEKLCGDVDAAIDKNKALLQVDGLLRPLLPRITEIRQGVRSELLENFKAACRKALEAHGVYCCNSMLVKNIAELGAAQYPPFGKFGAFVGAILGRVIYSRDRNLCIEVANALNLPAFSEKQKNAYRAELAVHGITDRITLFQKGGGAKIRKATFGKFGRAFAFAAAILEKTVTQITNDILKEIADSLDFPEVTEEEMRGRYRATLTKHGIIDRETLLAKGPNWFAIEARFPPFGGGRAFIAQVLDCGNVRMIDISLLEQLADKLGYAKLTREEKLCKYRAALVAHGISDREELLRLGARPFIRLDFGIYGHGIGIAIKITERQMTNVSTETLHEIADALGFSRQNDAEKSSSYPRILSGYGVTDRASLLSMGPKWFRETEFGTFGLGFAFAGSILGRKIHNINYDTLHEIADALGFSKDMSGACITAFAQRGITDRASLIRFGIVQFLATNFKPFGKGAALITIFLDERTGQGKLAHLERVADKLGW